MCDSDEDEEEEEKKGENSFDLEDDLEDFHEVTGISTKIPE